MIYIGIDPGKTGCVCVLSPDGGLALIDHHELIVQDLVGIKAQYGDNLCCLIERQQSMPKQGLASTCTCCFGYGQYYGALQALGIAFETVRSQEWMKGLGIPAKLDLKVRKRKIAECMLNKYPTAELHGPRGGLKDGRSDALAIADYLKRRESATS